MVSPLGQHQHFVVYDVVQNLSLGILVRAKNSFFLHFRYINVPTLHFFCCTLVSYTLLLHTSTACYLQYKSTELKVNSITKDISLYTKIRF